MSSPEAYRQFKSALGAAPYLNLTPDSAILAQTQVSRTVWQRVDTPTIAGYLGSRLMLASFLTWAAAVPSTASLQAKEAAAELSLAFNNPNLVPSFDMENPATQVEMQAALTALIGAPQCPITQTIADGILALAQKTTTDAEQWGFRAPPTQADLDAARRL